MGIFFNCPSGSSASRTFHNLKQDYMNPRQRRDQAGRTRPRNNPRNPDQEKPSYPAFRQPHPLRTTKSHRALLQQTQE